MKQPDNNSPGSSPAVLPVVFAALSGAGDDEAPGLAAAGDGTGDTAGRTGLVLLLLPL